MIQPLTTYNRYNNNDNRNDDIQVKQNDFNN